VEKGQVLASVGRPGSNLRVCSSPVRGRVSDLEFNYGVITIDPLREELEVRAWLPGVVEEVTDRGARIACEGVEITGAWGLGGEVHGPLSFGDPARGAILVREVVSGAELRRLEGEAITGLVTGGLHLHDLSGLAPAFTIVLLGRFGADRLAEPLLDVLHKYEGRLALLDGNTQLRVGVRRPRILLPG
jgi:hypothetical protein